MTKPRLAAVFYGVNNFIQTPEALRFAQENATPGLTSFTLVDNGSNPSYSSFEWSKSANVIRYEKNIGGNAVFHRWYHDAWFGTNPPVNIPGEPAQFGSTGLPVTPEFIAFFHCDLYIREKGWDQKLVDAFDKYPRLALQGFVGSNQIDERGGRGSGTMLNYLGAFYPGIGQASRAEQHGARVTGLHAAAVLDHCALVFRTSDLITLTPQEGNFAPEHFYDRHLCCEVLSKGRTIAVNGISCDHFSGGIAGGVLDAAALCRSFLDSRNIPYKKDEERSQTYVESEKDFHKRYLANNFIPLRVDAAGNVIHEHISRGGFWHSGWSSAMGRRRVDGRNI